MVRGNKHSLLLMPALKLSGSVPSAKFLNCSEIVSLTVNWVKWFLSVWLKVKMIYIYCKWTQSRVNVIIILSLTGQLESIRMCNGPSTLAAGPTVGTSFPAGHYPLYLPVTETLMGSQKSLNRCSLFGRLRYLHAHWRVFETKRTLTFTELTGGFGCFVRGGVYNIPVSSKS